MAIVTFPSIATDPTYVRTFPRASPFRRFPIARFASGILSISYTATTLATILARVRERLFSTFWSGAELTAYINEALRIWNTLTGYWRSTYSINVGAGVQFITLTDVIPDYLELLRVTINNTYIDPVTVLELGEIDPTWRSRTATVVPTEVANLGFSRVAFSPVSSATFTAVVDYIQVAPQLVNSTDVLQMGEEDIIAIIDYVQFIAALKEGTTELQTMIPSFQRFLEQASKYNARLNAISVFRSLLGKQDQVQTRSDTSTSENARI